LSSDLVDDLSGSKDLENLMTRFEEAGVAQFCLKAAHSLEKDVFTRQGDQMSLQKIAQNVAQSVF
jgi:hypothetical protein